MKNIPTDMHTAPTNLAADDARPRAIIKLGIDAHADDFRVVVMSEGRLPKPARRFTSVAELVNFAAGLVRGAAEVHSCYEAGPLGYGLHRALCAVGVNNRVVVPVNLDESGKRVKTDAKDALALCVRLDRHVAGSEAFSVVAVPTPEQERARTLGRERDSLLADRKRHAAHVCSVCLYYGVRLPGDWWRERPAREGLLSLLPDHLAALARSRLRLIDILVEEMAAIAARLEAEAPAGLPRYVGAMSASLLDREVRDWGRFKNRRQVGSYTGLCPTEDSSGGRRFQGGVNKHGNPRVRRLAIELAWRLLRHQHGYRVVKKWMPKYKAAAPGRRKQIAVAVAREFIVDWWRVRTGRCTAESLGLDVPALEA
jgi:transposase